MLKKKNTLFFQNNFNVSIARLVRLKRYIHFYIPFLHPDKPFTKIPEKEQKALDLLKEFFLESGLREEVLKGHFLMKITDWRRLVEESKSLNGLTNVMEMTVLELTHHKYSDTSDKRILVKFSNNGIFNYVNYDDEIVILSKHHIPLSEKYELALYVIL